MSVTKGMPTRSVKFRGTFSYSDLLQAVRGWFGDNYYRFDEPTHKWKSGGEGVEAEIKMKGARKMNEYVKYHVEVWVRIWDMKEVEVIKDGQKMVLNDGKVAIETTGKVEFDWANRFQGSKFLQNLQDFFHKFIIRQDISDKWEDGLFKTLIEFTKMIKEKIGYEAV